MAQPLQNITISAPAFKGLNTQDSPLNQDPQFASVADNVVIDSYGRIGARKGLKALTDPSYLIPYSGEPVTIIHEAEKADGTTRLILAIDGTWKTTSADGSEINGGNTIYAYDDSLPLNFNDKTYIFSEGQVIRIYDPSTNNFSITSSQTGASTFQPDGNVALGAFGRVWCTDTGAPNTIYWSDLLAPHIWDAGSSGSINLDKVWADGADRIMALAAWNGYLVIFGYNSIILYQGAEDPATMSLADTVSGVGCIARDSIQATGNDLLFLSTRGLMTLGRTIQEKSNPINDVSRNIHDDFTTLIKQETSRIKSVYSGSEGFYLLLLPDTGVVFCFDVRGLLENGAYRVTRWITDNMVCFCNRQDDTLLIGNTYGINTYEGYQDNGESYSLRYYSNPLSFGNPSQLKFLKKITPTIIGGSSETVEIKWSYDFNNSYKSQAFGLASSANIGYFGISEFNSTAEFVSGNNSVTVKRINATGSGNLITIGIESEVNGASLSLQEFNIQAITGKTY
jgi:hypothetical protein